MEQLESMFTMDAILIMKVQMLPRKNFIAVLKGDSTSTGGKPVLKSGPNDDVFINFVDHGAAGLIAFPSEYLYANDLNTTLTYMY